MFVPVIRIYRLILNCEKMKNKLFKINVWFILLVLTVKPVPLFAMEEKDKGFGSGFKKGFFGSVPKKKVSVQKEKSSVPVPATEDPINASVPVPATEDPINATAVISALQLLKVNQPENATVFGKIHNTKGQMHLI